MDFPFWLPERHRPPCERRIRNNPGIAMCHRGEIFRIAITYVMVIILDFFPFG